MRADGVEDGRRVGDGGGQRGSGGYLWRAEGACSSAFERALAQCGGSWVQQGLSVTPVRGCRGQWGRAEGARGRLVPTRAQYRGSHWRTFSVSRGGRRGTASGEPNAGGGPLRRTGCCGTGCPGIPG